MKKIATAILLACVLTIQAQVVELAKPFDFSQLKPGDAFSLTIKNTGTEARTFYPLTVFDSTGNYLFLDEQHYHNYLLSPKTAIGAIRNHARIVKSNRFVSNIYESNDLADPKKALLLENKKNSVIGWPLSSAFHFGNSYWKNAYTNFVSAKIFPPTGLRSLGTKSLQPGEVIIKGDTLLVDLDPRFSRFLDTLPDGTYASAEEVKRHTGYISGQNPYTYCDPARPKNCKPLSDVPVKNYAALFEKVQYYGILDIQPVPVSGKWILCPNCEIKWNWKAPAYILDMRDPVRRALYDTLVWAYKQKDDPNLKTFVTQTTEKLFGAKLAELEKNGSDFMLLEENFDLALTETYQKDFLIKLHIPARAKDIVIGKDLALPFLIKQITTDKPVAIGDTTFPAGTSKVTLWDENDKTGAPVSVSNGQFQYLQSGTIPAGATVDLLLYYNQLIYALPNGLKAEFFGVEPADIQVTQSPKKK